MIFSRGCFKLILNFGKYFVCSQTPDFGKITFIPSFLQISKGYFCAAKESLLVEVFRDNG